MYTITTPRAWLAAFALLAGLLLAQAAPAHHGWGWASDQEFELSGTITAVRLGNPHGELTVDVDGQSWVVEVGQPWRNRRAGLDDELLRVGTRITVHGHRATDPARRLIKAERLVIDGKDYVLYPDRES